MHGDFVSVKDLILQTLKSVSAEWDPKGQILKNISTLKEADRCLEGFSKVPKQVKYLTLTEVS